MTAGADERKNRILELIIAKTFGIFTEDKEKELDQLLSHPDEVNADWKRLLDRDKLMDYLRDNLNDGQQFDVDAAKKQFAEWKKKFDSDK